MNNFYVYGYFRNKNGFAPAGTPYYIGKGKNRRAWSRCRRGDGFYPPKDPSQIKILFSNISENEAFVKEIHLIALYGRINAGTGILRNLTDGGEGTSKRVCSPETRAKLRAALKGKKYGPQSSEHRANIALGLTGKKRGHPSQEWIAKIKASLTGKFTFSEKRLINLRAVMATPEYRTTQSIAQLNRDTRTP